MPIFEKPESGEENNLKIINFGLDLKDLGYL